jgi:hypothetical protein
MCRERIVQGVDANSHCGAHACTAKRYQLENSAAADAALVPVAYGLLPGSFSVNHHFQLLFQVHRNRSCATVVA